MAVLLDEKTKLVVQGITGHQGQFHTEKMLEYGTKVVAGVTPGKGGERVHDVPVYDSCFEAVDATGANASILFVPPPYPKDAQIEAIQAGDGLQGLIRERYPFPDARDSIRHAGRRAGGALGPNCACVT